MKNERTREIYLDWNGVVDVDYIQRFDLITDEPVPDRFVTLSVAMPEPYNLTSQLVHFDPAVVTLLNELNQLPEVSVLWLSATGFLAREVYGPAVGLDSFDALPGAPSSPGQQGAPENGRMAGSWWKGLVVQDHLEATDADALWIDDSIYPDFQRVLRQRGETPGGSQLAWLTPEARQGITVRHMLDIRRWATGEPVPRHGANARRRREPQIQWARPGAGE